MLNFSLARWLRSIGRAKDLAEQSAVTKDHFLANMSHEIRTPMNAVMGFTNLLENTKLDDQQKEFVHAIKMAGKNLLSIIDDILDYSKIESGMVTFEQIPLNVRNIFSSLGIVFQQKALEKRIALSFDADAGLPSFVSGDPSRLRQILSNLVDNALKFTEKGSVTIKATVAEQTPDSVIIAFSVADTGSGIPNDKIATVFNRFTQASEETSRKYGGTGLGLSIVKRLVELQKGTVAVQSKAGEGSIFSCNIPFKKVSMTDAEAEIIYKQPATVKRNAPRILVAEDNLLNQMLVLHFSKNHGFETEVAENGKIALEKMKNNAYDLILMDIQMPEMDGYEATTIIRGTLKSDIPIIALTAHAMDGEKEKCLSMGMNDFVTKPFDPLDLYNKITFYLN